MVKLVFHYMTQDLMPTKHRLIEKTNHNMIERVKGQSGSAQLLCHSEADFHQVSTGIFTERVRSWRGSLLSGEKLAPFILKPHQQEYKNGVEKSDFPSHVEPLPGEI
tara:strand:+ start:109249 stop:109569 length:321 start_codon:yes stop_codon:yes gene_type:complete